MAKGDGSVVEVKRRDGRSYRPKHWKVRIDLGKDPLTGKRRTPFTKTVKGTKAEACRVRDSMRDEVTAGLKVEDKSTMFKVFATQWHENREASGKLSRTRMVRVKGILDLLNRYLGDLEIADITPQVIDGVIASIRRDKVEELGAYSNTSLDMIFKVLRQVLDKAVDYGIIAANPAKRAEAPTPDKSERRSLSVEESRRLLQVIDRVEVDAYAHRDSVEVRRKQRKDSSEPKYLRGMSRISNVIAARIGLATGLRRGEVLALTWNCVDLDRGFLSVIHSINTYGEVKEPKTRAGIRKLSIDKTTVGHLKLWRTRQREEFTFLGIEQTGDTPVCCSDLGTYMIPTNFSRWWRSFADENGFNGLKFHELRHTQATQLIGNDVDMKVVQHRLGHSSFSLTMDLYAHALPENDRAAADTIGRLFSTPDDSAGESGGLRLVS